MPLRVLYIVSTLARCGPVNVLHGIIKHLDRSEFEPIILTLSEEKGDSIKQVFVDMGVACHTLGLSRFEFLLVGKSRIRRFINTIQPALIHAHGYRADIAVSSLPASKPIFTTIHNNPLEDYRYLYGNIAGTSIYYHHLAALKQISYPIVVGNHIKSELSNSFRQQIYVVENGIDTDYFAMIDETEKRRRRNECGLPNDSTVLIFTGVLSKRKDPLLLIRAFRNSKLYNKAHLIIVGDGPLYAECARYADERLIFTGAVKDVRVHLQLADIYVSCAKSEGIPMSVLEGMGCGLSVHLSDIPAHREIVSKSQECGSLFADSIDTLVNSFNELAARQSFAHNGAAARATAVQHYSSLVMSVKYSKLYKEISENSVNA